MTIHVTHDHIRAGHGGDYESDAMALAIKDATGALCVAVGDDCVQVDGDVYPLPPRATAFVYNLDNRLPVYPLSFELPIPRGKEAA